MVSAEEKRHVAAQITWVSVAVNIVLVVMQIVVGVWAKSQSLIADGVHSLSDIVSDFVVLAVNRVSHVEADAQHPYGHARFETAASLFLGGILLAVGLGMLWTAGENIQQPELIEPVHQLALYAALVTLVSKELLFRYMLRAARRVQSGLLIANAWHARSDAASSLVVAVGVVGSLAGYRLFDPIAAAFVGLMIVRMGGQFAWRAFADLMDRGLDEMTVSALHRTLLGTSGVQSVHELRTRKMGDDALLDAHLRVRRDISVSEGHYIAVQARRSLLREHAIADAVLHIDSEDDQDTGAVGVESLPSREEIERALVEHLSAEHYGLIQRVQLHYLEQGVRLEIILNSEGYSEAKAIFDSFTPRLRVQLHLSHVMILGCWCSE